MKFRVSILASAFVGALGGTAVTAALLLNNAQAADQQPAAAPPAILTVYVEEHFGSAKKLNEIHNQYYAQGYRFASMVAHRENSDQEGLWVTYVLKD
ncbi:MAG TPA: hypothetical protein VKB41_10765 [Steroidobacteraceae bacterium]|jgi:hypothetical protein|nr:hypothetical protein [Steroidobacteraceae bacterium]